MRFGSAYSCCAFCCGGRPLLLHHTTFFMTTPAAAAQRSHDRQERARQVQHHGRVLGPPRIHQLLVLRHHLVRRAVPQVPYVHGLQVGVGQLHDLLGADPRHAVAREGVLRVHAVRERLVRRRLVDLDACCGDAANAASSEHSGRVR